MDRKSSDEPGLEGPTPRTWPSRWLRKFDILLNLKDIAAIVLFVAGLFSLFSGLLAPDFYVHYEYQWDDPVPVSALVKGVTQLEGTCDAPILATILRLQVGNRNKRSEATNVRISIRGAMRRVFFVIDSYGDHVEVTPQPPVDKVSQLNLKLGDLGQASVMTIFIGAEFGLFFEPVIEARSSSAGLASVRHRGSVTGIKFFVADNLEWIAALVFLLFAILLLRSPRRR